MNRSNEHITPLPSHFVDRAAHYRNLAKREADPAKAAEHRRMATMMDRQAAHALEANRTAEFLKPK